MAIRLGAIVLVGLSGSGKSTVGPLVAARLGRRFFDLDRNIEEMTRVSIPELFEIEGEPGFRAREAALLDDWARYDDRVLSTGGGALTTADGRGAAGRGFVVWLRVSPEEAARRLAANPATEARPLLEGDPLGRLRQLAAARQHQYAAADAVVDVDGRTPGEVAEAVVKAWEGGRRQGRLERLQPAFKVAATVRTRAAGSEYHIHVAPGALAQVGVICREAGLSGRAFLLSDEHVAPLFSGRARQALEASGYTVPTCTIPAGEAHKNATTLGSVYDWLLGERVERTDFVVCLGGGVVTDLGGFAAATVLRGIPFVHVPTTLLAMVDAAVGGKTGIDHARGKNMIGAFAQPAAVIVDPAVLETLPERERRAGWAEVVKHGLILDEALVRDLEARAGDPRALFSEELIGRSVAIKAAVVSGDEREAGRRTLLNYGHTIGHAVEVVTGFDAYLHGEAISVGMHAAGLIAVDLGMLTTHDFDRQQRLLSACGLPNSAPGLDPGAILDAMLSDKKVRAGSVSWVLLDRIGHAVVRRDVPPAVVRKAVEAVLR